MHGRYICSVYTFYCIHNICNYINALLYKVYIVCSKIKDYSISVVKFIVCMLVNTLWFPSSIRYKIKKDNKISTNSYCLLEQIWYSITAWNNICRFSIHTGLKFALWDICISFRNKILVLLNIENLDFLFEPFILALEASSLVKAQEFIQKS